MRVEFLYALIGGVLIGLASLIASGATGKIPGISGVFSKLFFFKPGDTFWRALFLLGLIIGGILAFPLNPAYHPVKSLAVVAIAGLLVGFGTRLGGGCTSGHGVCGMGLGAKDSIVATLTFMAAGFVTVYLTHHVF
ncbi:MAG: YeeE/YedE thiosulfate transporter family protein [Luteolibacter sp.]